MSKIVIIFGHGSNDSGAVANGLVERDINIIQGEACGKVLTEHGINVIYDDKNTKVNDEVNKINSIKADITINIHNNSGGGNGFEAYYYTSNPNAKKLCQCIEKRVMEIGQNSRGLKSGNNLAVIRKTSPLSILVEGAFLDSNDRFIINTVEKQIKMGEAYAKGILDYLGIAYKPHTQTSTNDIMYRVVVGSYKDKNNAIEMQNKLKQKGFESFLATI